MSTSDLVQSPAQPEPPRPLKREFGPFARAFAGRFFESSRLPAEAVDSLSALSAQGEVVHVMRSAGTLNFLWLAYQLLLHALPPLRAAIGLHWCFWSPFRRLFHEGTIAQRLGRALDAGASALVFLREPSGWIPTLEPKDDPFFALVARARQATRPLYLVPELFLWRNRARNLRPTIRDLLFGDAEAPGILASAVGFLLYHRNAFVRIGKPIDLTAFVRDNPEASDAVIVRKVRGSLFQHLARETRSIVGPPRKQRSRVIEEVLRDRTLRANLEQEVAERGVGLERCRSEAQRDLEEIAADQTPEIVAAFCVFLTWLFNRVYAGVEVDEKGLQRTLDTAREAPLVFCPSHKSHLDYMLLAWVLMRRGITPPLVAAGANLSFWPLGAIFRRSGAFFLRRSFKGDRIYSASFRAYVKKLLKEGHSQEFFIEGGRSRTGKLLNPKLGMISFVVDAFLEGAQDDVYFVPVAIDYERVMEAKSYARELAGGEKKPESIRSLLTTPKVLVNKYGRVYLSFDEPISLRKFLQSRAPELAALVGEERRAATRALAQRVTWGVSHVSTITPAALLAAALLAHREKSISARAVATRIDTLRALAEREGARLSPVLAKASSNPSEPGPLNEVLRLLMEDGLVEAQAVGDDIVYSVPPDRRPALCYYKNNLVHLIVRRAFVAAAVLAEGGATSAGRMSEHVRLLVKLLKLEFSFPVGDRFERALERSLGELVEEGLLTEESDQIRLGPAKGSRETLVFLNELNRDVLESYRLMASVLDRAATPVDRKELLKLALEKGRADLASGALSRSEALSRPTLENALALFADQGLLVEEGRKLKLGAEGLAPVPRLLESLAPFLVEK